MKGKLPEIGRISHSEAKKLMPPGGQLWQDKDPGGWHSRMPPLKEHARSWSKYGQEEAMFLVVKEAWRQYCYLEGLTPEQCQMEHVF